jgi:uncharacterized membrane protein
MTIFYNYYFFNLLFHHTLITCFNWDLGFSGQADSGSKGQHVAMAFGASFGAVFVIILLVGLIVWWRYRHNQQIFFDVNGW